MTGNMPPGDMTVARYARDAMSLPGHEAYGTIVITYSHVRLHVLV